MGNKDEGRNPAAIRKSLEPLVEWFKANKPDCKRVAVMPVDMDRIAKAQKKTLDRNEISKVGTPSTSTASSCTASRMRFLARSTE